MVISQKAKKYLQQIIHIVRCR